MKIIFIFFCFLLSSCQEDLNTECYIGSNLGKRLNGLCIKEMYLGTFDEAVEGCVNNNKGSLPVIPSAEYNGEALYDSLEVSCDNADAIPAWNSDLFLGIENGRWLNGQQMNFNAYAPGESDKPGASVMRRKENGTWYKSQQKASIMCLWNPARYIKKQEIGNPDYDENTQQYVWIGLTGNGTNWIWADGSVMTFNNFYNTTDIAAGCAAMIMSGPNTSKWISLHCDTEYIYVCQYRQIV